ncbi:RNA polymerase sigma factor [Cyclobacterium marinum]|uniref:RNA polymerase, sigma-24 subunit, ECF subfamily n=1 Tax=Cyclobacterium marinum (strain ATCC 25205 / DSM 745 / LMG 13164 / NCIMB 1802) TaxID=880070 RepID=G0J0I7_CYCMS|nr:sigma-70 family RNA polymerase sigma factor [Cyclobacterium marinum]AEL23903.1 RNA polymerase, sigma-24 subunit, ECF subfamily [Cyclobacterium marinum DSM 745]MBI0398696.1 sigma-70 family RNA polymerase sigma factor [Cyclobacterium marinum]|tara:strand:- start:30417 stop:30887 length:471 start_codon:yes stop_codon:yes gene_type:complete
MEREFLNIVEANQGIIFKVCKLYRNSKEDQEDLFQEIVLQLWRAFPKFRKESKVSTWMYRIALNTAIAMFRKHKIEIEFNEYTPKEIYSNQESEQSENEERLFDAIRTLNQTERAIIALFLEGFNYKEIGEITGITENYVGVKINRIKEKLKIILK